MDRWTGGVRARWSAAAAVVAASLSAVVASHPRDAAPTRAAVLTVVGLGVVATLVAGRGRQRCSSACWAGGIARRLACRSSSRTAARRGALVWIGLVGTIVAWDAVSFAEQRPDFPTLSHYLGVVTAESWGRGLLVAAWVGWGAWTATGWRTRR